MFKQLRQETALYLADFMSHSVLNELRKSWTTDQLQKEAALVEQFAKASSAEALDRALEKPKKLEHGHLALPLFPFAKALRMAPPQLAQIVASLLQAKLGDASSAKLGLIAVNPVGGFLNLTFADRALQLRLFDAMIVEGARLGFSTRGQGKRIVIDYSSPNVAKPMHVGHLRATVIGQAIRNLAETQGYEVIGLNHLGDWGVQFGKLAWAYQAWGAEYDFKNKPFQSLFEIYVRFHEEAEKAPELEAQGSLVFKNLESGDQAVESIWKMFVEISLVEYQRLWDLLGVKHDLVRGESFYNSRLKAVEAMLESKGLLVESQGASVVMLGDEMPPCLIRKSDGASLYATRDIASAIYRKEELKADLSLYVVAVDQSLHFKQVFKVLELCGYDWAKDCHHIAFGMYRFKEGMKMSTRKGQVVFLEDVLKQAIERTAIVVAEKNPNLSPAEQVSIAHDVGVGAVIFNDLLFDRIKNVEFDWDRILSFDGDSGPYVQYMYVRCASLIRKYGKETDLKPTRTLDAPEERELVRVLLAYDDVLEMAFDGFRPNVLAQYLLEVCAVFSRFYHNNRILGEERSIEASRMALVCATKEILQQGLKQLSIRCPEFM